MAENVIQVVLRSVNEMSQDIQRIDTDLGKLRGTTESTGTSFAKTAQSTRLLGRDLLPLRVLLIRMTGLTGGFGSALSNLILFGFKPLSIAITAIIAATVLLASKWSEAKKTAEELTKAAGDISTQLAMGNVEYRAMIGVITEADAAAQKFFLGQAKMIEDLTQKVEAQRGSFLNFALGLRGLISGQTLGEKLGLGAKTPLQQAEEQLARFSQGVQSTGRQIKKGLETQPVVAFTKSLKEQIVQLKIQAIELELGSEEALRYSLEQKVLAAGLPIGRFRSLIEQIVMWTRGIRITKEETEKLAAVTKMWDTDLEALSDPLRSNAELLEWNKKRTEELGEAQKSLTDIILDGVEMRKEGLEKEIFQVARWESEQMEALKKLGEKYPELADKINEAMRSINEQALQKTTEALKRSQQEAERVAGDLAKSFADRFISMMEGEKGDILGFFRDLGRAMVSEMLQEMLAAMLLEPVTEQMRGGKQPRTTAGLLLGGAKSFLSLLGLFGGGVAPLTQWERTAGQGLEFMMGKGGHLPGSFMPVAALRKFQKGGVARGPTLGVIGEEGDEIVARMKPAGQQDSGFQELRQNIFLVDDRRKVPPLGPRDVIMIVADDMNRGGDTAKTTQNVIKRL